VRVRPADPADLDGLEAALRRAGGAVEAVPAGLTVAGLAPAEVGWIALAAGVAVQELAVQEHRLEESFLALTGGAR